LEIYDICTSSIVSVPVFQSMLGVFLFILAKI